MTFVLLSILILVCLAILAEGFKEKELLIQYTFLSTSVFVGWVIPQLIGLTNSHDLPDGALSKTVGMTLLCVISIYLGGFVKKPPLRSFNWSLSRPRLLHGALFLSVFGAFFYYQVSLLADEATRMYGGAWTGIITVYVLFSTMVTFGLVLALLCHFNSPTKLSFFIIIFDVALYLDRIVIRGRRQAAVEFFVIFGLTLWFYRKKLPSRIIVLCVLLVGSFWVNSVGQYRANMLGEEGLGFRGVVDIDFVGNFVQVFEEGGQELKNATYVIEAKNRQVAFDFGLSHWNGFVLAYVPAQFLGNEFKNSLMFDLQDSAYEEFSYISNEGGSTSTGMADSFSSFWFFGALKFFVISYLMAKIYLAAINGNFIARAFFMLAFTGALESITHGTDRFFMLWPKIFIFLIPVFLYAKIGGDSSRIRKEVFR